MGVAARRIERETRGRRDHLRAVPAPACTPKRPANSRANVRAREARAKSAFNVAVVLLVVLTAVALVRVAVLARAAEMTLTESTLTKRIKSQRIETDRLEIDRSGLATPSRIEEIAGATMQMGRPKSVRYITLADTDGRIADATAPADTRDDARSASVAGPDRMATVLSAIAEVTAGEAQALLVGDVGLAGSR